MTVNIIQEKMLNLLANEGSYIVNVLEHHLDNEYLIDIRGISTSMQYCYTLSKMLRTKDIYEKLKVFAQKIIYDTHLRKSSYQDSMLATQFAFAHLHEPYKPFETEIPSINNRKKRKRLLNLLNN